MVAPPELPTVGVIAEKFGVPVHRVEYVIRRWTIVPASRAGNAYVYSDDDVEFIGAQLQRTQADRGEGDDA
jgi:DNA-binding transcriptional MerR regulator